MLVSVGTRESTLGEEGCLQEAVALFVAPVPVT